MCSEAPSLKLGEDTVQNDQLFHMAPYMLPRIQNVMDKLVLKPLISKVYSMEDATKVYEATESDQYPHILVRINGC
jgi:hypothetical protein